MGVKKTETLEDLKYQSLLFGSQQSFVFVL